jgi:hypothetical protein
MHATRFWPALGLTQEQKAGVEDPVEMQRLADDLSVEQTARRFIVSTDPDEHVEKIKTYLDLGFNHLVFHAPGSCSHAPRRTRRGPGVSTPLKPLPARLPGRLCRVPGRGTADAGRRPARWRRRRRGIPFPGLHALPGRFRARASSGVGLDFLGHGVSSCVVRLPLVSVRAAAS